MPKMFARCAAAALLALTPPASGWAATLKIYPVLVALDDKTPVETMTIENSGDAPARMQVRVVAWRQDNGQDLFEETRDILANPPLFEIAPGGQQIARFGLRTASAPTEKSYRVFLEEIPTDRPTAAGEIRTLLRVSIPIFVTAPGAQASLAWQLTATNDRQLMLTARNEGSAHVHLNRLDLKRADGTPLATRQESIYNLPGATRTFLFDMQRPVRGGEKLTLDAATGQRTLSAPLVLQAASHAGGTR
jgi:fimbrial chaperone protein